MTKVLIIFIAIIILLLIIVSRFASYNYIMSNLQNIIFDIALHNTYREFKKNNKQIYTKNDEHTIAFDKAVQTCAYDLNVANQFYSKDFYYYFKQNSPILKRNVIKLVRRYIRNHSKNSLANNFTSMTPDQFFKLRKTIQGDMVGIYILYNKNRKMYYVGQATRLFFRVHQHFTGHGNGDVYGDYKRGKDKFTIKLIPLVNSGYYDLDKLEKDMITKYDAYNSGYNKTAGNGYYA